MFPSRSSYIKVRSAHVRLYFSRCILHSGCQCGRLGSWAADCMLKSTAQWTWINIDGAQFYIQACQDANMQAVNCFSLMISVVLFDITGDYQLYYLYLTLLLLEQTYTETNTPRIGTVISAEHQISYWTYIAAANPPIKDLCEENLHKLCINSPVPFQFPVGQTTRAAACIQRSTAKRRTLSRGCRW